MLSVHRSAITLIASRDYTPEQIRAWLPEDGELESWAQRVRALAPFVVCDRRGVALPNALMRKVLPSAADAPGRFP